jgi:hypothetical protein
MRPRPERMTAAMVALAATGLVGCRAPEPPSASSSSSSVDEETAALDLCAGPAGLDLGGKIAFVSDRTGNYEVFVLNADCRAVTQLTHSPSADYHPAWSPDGTRIAFASSDGGDDIFVMNANGSGRTRLTASRGTTTRPPGHRTEPRSPSPAIAPATTRSSSDATAPGYLAASSCPAPSGHDVGRRRT